MLFPMAPRAPISIPETWQNSTAQSKAGPGPQEACSLLWGQSQTHLAPTEAGMKEVWSVRRTGLLVHNLGDSETMVEAAALRFWSPGELPLLPSPALLIVGSSPCPQ